MLTQQHNRYAATCSGLASAIDELTARIRVNENNKKVKADNEVRVDSLTHGIQATDNILGLLKPMLRDVKDYLNKKRAESMQSINNALRLAEEVVPDSEPGTHFVLNGDKAVLQAEDGLIVEGTEGGGFQQVSSIFLRITIARYNPGMLNTLFFDEVFSQLSPDNSATLSQYLNLFARDTQIISIEQKPQVYSNCDHVKYTFTKTDNFAEVTKEEVKRGENIGSVQA